jgi:hypothetical protein
LQIPAKSLAANPRQRRFRPIRCGELAATGRQKRGETLAAKMSRRIGKYS